MAVKRITDDQFLSFSPFDEGKGGCRIECHKVMITVIRKPQPCMASYLVPPNYKPHEVAANTRAWKESAKVDGQFGSCYSCLPCLRKLMIVSGIIDSSMVIE